MSATMLSRAARVAPLQRSGLAAALAPPLPSSQAGHTFLLHSAALQRHSRHPAGPPPANGSTAAPAGADARCTHHLCSGGDGDSGGDERSPAAQFERWLDSMRARGFAVRLEYWKRSIKLDGDGGKLRLWKTDGPFNRLPWMAAGAAGVFLTADGWENGLAAAVAFIAMWRWPIGVFAFACALMWCQQAAGQVGDS